MTPKKYPWKPSGTTLIPGNKVLISGLRYPFSQLKSDIHWIKLDKTKYLDGFENPFEKFLATKEIPTKGQKYLKIPEEYLENERQLEKYFDILEKAFSLIMITEYYDASLVLLRRILCWDIQDILYSRLKKGKYTYTNSTLLTETEKLHKELKPTEYALFNHFNQTFWSLVEKQPSSFWDEVNFYETLISNVSQLCQRFYTKLQQDPSSVLKIILKAKTPLYVKHSQWNEAFSIHAEDCILMKLKKMFFRNVSILKNFPHLCTDIRKKQPKYFRHSGSAKRIRPTTMKVRNLHGNDVLIFNPLYCFPSKISRYHLPLEVLARKELWEWDDPKRSPHLS